MDDKNRLVDRISLIRAKSTDVGVSSGKTRIDVRPRNKKLLSLEGWYTAKVGLETLPHEYNKLVKEYKGRPRSVSFTKWLSKSKKLENEVISETGKLLMSVTFKLSCRHKDLLRLSETKHYRSCFNRWRGVQQLRFLADPDIGVLYVPDASGKYLWRTLVRLMLHNSKHVLLTYKTYGNANESAIFNKMNGIIPVYTATAQYLDGRLWENDLVSATIHNNTVVGRHVWSDHRCVLNPDTMRITMTGYKIHI